MPPRFCFLEDRALIEARGRDAQSFLNAQMSQALDDLQGGSAPLAGWHDARGRVRALVRVLRAHERWLLITPGDGAAELVVALRRFILRADVRLDLASDLVVAALIDVDARWLQDQGLSSQAAGDSHIEREAIQWLCIAPDYWQVVGPPDALKSLADSLTSAPAAAADLAEIRLGLANVDAAQSGRFVAQTLNLDRIGAIAFGKGCYPGQEIIARVHHLGDVKRHIRRFALSRAAAPPNGVALIGADGAEAGEVLRSAPTDGGIELLAVVDDRASLPLSLEGIALRSLPLPATREEPASSQA